MNENEKISKDDLIDTVGWFVDTLQKLKIVKSLNDGQGLYHNCSSYWGLYD